MQLIQLTVLSRATKALASLSWVFDISDISQPMKPAGGGPTVIMIREGRQDYNGNQNETGTVTQYTVNESITAINALEPNLIPLNVINMKDRPVLGNPLWGFHIGLIAGPVQPNGSGGSIFYYQEEGDPELVKYEVSQPPSAFITASSGINCSLVIACVNANILKYYKEDSVSPTTTPVATGKSVAIGDGAQATGGTSFAAGSLTHVAGLRSVGVGYQNIVPSTDSGAFGKSNTIAGGLTKAYAFGYNNTPAHSDTYCLGENITTQASGTINIGVNDATKVTVNFAGDLSYGGTTGQLKPNGIGGTAGYFLQANGPGVADTWVPAPTVTADWELGGNAVAGIQTFGTTTNFDVPMIANNVEMMRLAAGAGVAVGLTVPTATLHIQGPGLVAGAYPLKVQDSGADALLFVQDDGSIGGGFNSTATGQGAIALGRLTAASALGAISIGNSNTSSNTISVAIGDTMIASGDHAWAIGNQYCTSSGTESLSMGEYLTASNTRSHVIGNGISNVSRLINNTVASLMIGYNSDTPTVFVGPGNGTPGSIGAVGIGGMIAPTATLHVTTTSSLITDFVFRVSAQNGAKADAFTITAEGEVCVNSIPVPNIISATTDSIFQTLHNGYYFQHLRNTLSFGNATIQQFIGQIGATFSVIGNFSNHDVRIRTNNADVLVVTATAQVGIGTIVPITSAALDITSTTGALVVPRMTTLQRTALTAANGMIVYDTDLNSFYKYAGGVWVVF
jgi:hypothetical protein